MNADLEQDTAAVTGLKFSALQTNVSGELQATRVESGQPAVESTLDVQGEDLAVCSRYWKLNPGLLHDVLRGEWGFEGFVVSDAMAVGNLVIQGHARDKREAALRSLQAGLNMDMASNSYLENLFGEGRIALAGADRRDGAADPGHQGTHGIV